MFITQIFSQLAECQNKENDYEVIRRSFTGFLYLARHPRTVPTCNTMLREIAITVLR